MSEHTSIAEVEKLSQEKEHNQNHLLYKQEELHKKQRKDLMFELVTLEPVRKVCGI